MRNFYSLFLNETITYLYNRICIYIIHFNVNHPTDTRNHLILFFQFHLSHIKGRRQSKEDKISMLNTI